MLFSKILVFVAGFSALISGAPLESKWQDNRKRLYITYLRILEGKLSVEVRDTTVISEPGRFLKAKNLEDTAVQAIEPREGQDVASPVAEPGRFL